MSFDGRLSRNPIPETPLCPNSPQILADSVVLESRINDDGLNIERSLASGNNTSLVSRKLTQSEENILKYAPATDISNISWSLKQVLGGRRNIDFLRQLKRDAMQSQKVRDYIRSAGAIPVLVSFLERYALRVRHGNTLCIEKSEEIINIFSLLDFWDRDTASLLTRPGSLECIGRALHLGRSESRTHAAVLLAELVKHRKLRETVGSKALVAGLVQVLRDDLSLRTTKACLNSLLALCTSEIARVRAVKAGAIPALVELLVQEEKTVCEKALASLELLLLCPEGRSAALAYAQFIPRVVQKILTISKEATEYAIGALWALCNYCPFLSGYYDTLQAGAVEKAKLLLVNGECSPRTTYQTRQLLHSLNSANNLLKREITHAILETPKY